MEMPSRYALHLGGWSELRIISAGGSDSGWIER